MSTPRDFIEAVVAWPGSGEPGYVNLHWTNERYPMLGRPFRSLDEFMNLAQWGTANPAAMRDIYFCLSVQAVVGKKYKNGKVSAARSTETALWLKAIWIDIDVKKGTGYGTLSEAFTAFEDFLARCALPAPSAIVLSGGGMHVYWISNRKLSPSEWRPYATGLRAEIARCGLKCDAGLTTDAARILRVPGTFNFKTSPPKPVRLASFGKLYDFGAQERLSLLATIAPAVTAPVTKNAAAPFDLAPFAGGPVKAFSALQQASLTAGINTYDDTPLTPDAVFERCPHFLSAAQTHGKNFPQGLWMLDVLAATFMDDGRRWAHYFSNGYTGYSRDETDKMFDRKLAEREKNGLGWPSCEAFENAGCKECAACPLRGKIKSPLNLAEREAPIPSVPSVNAATAPAPIESITLPDGYAIDHDGIICELIEAEGKSGVFETQLVPLFKCRMRNFTVVHGDPARLKFQVELDKGNWQERSVTEKEMATEAGLMTALRSVGVKPHPTNKRRIELFMTSFMQKLDQEKQRLNTVPFGWVHTGVEKTGFSYGGTLIKSDGSTYMSGIIADEISRAYQPAGSIDPWLAALKIVTDQKHPALEAIIAMSFAAPLMHSTGLYNGVLHAWSMETGAHKSTSIALGLAVWANPQAAKENKMTTPKAMLKKLGELKNLPIYWDELNRPDQLKYVQQFLDVATEGRGGLYLTKDRDFRHPEDWQSLVCIGANCSLYEFLHHTNKSTDAQLQRVFEIKVAQRGDTANPLAVARLISELDRNYGHMGLKYAALLATQAPQIDKLVTDTWDTFNARLGIQSGERFRAALAATIYVGAVLANKIGATFNEKLLYAYLVDEFFKQRKTIADLSPVAGSYMNTANVLSRFLNTVTRNVLWVNELPFGRGKPKPVTVLQGPKIEDPVFVRCIANAQSPMVQILKTKLDEFIREEGMGATAVIGGIKKHFGASISRLSLTAGTNRVGVRGDVINIPADGGIFYELCFAQTPPEQRPPEREDIVVASEDEASETPAIDAAFAQAKIDNQTVQDHQGGNHDGAAHG